MITGEINPLTLARTSRPVRTITHELVVRFSRGGRNPQACPKDGHGVLNPHVVRDGAREHPADMSSTATPLEPHSLPIDDPTLGPRSRP